MECDGVPSTVAAAMRRLAVRMEDTQVGLAPMIFGTLLAPANTARLLSGPEPNG